MVEEAVDEDALADVEGRLHRLRGDLVRLDQPGLDRQGQPQRQRDDHDQLDDAAGARSVGFGISGFSPSPRRSRLGLPRLGLPCFGSLLSPRCRLGLGLRLGLRRLRSFRLIRRLASASASPTRPWTGLSASDASAAGGVEVAPRPSLRGRGLSVGRGPPSSASQRPPSWLTPSASTASDSTAAAGAEISSSSIPQRRSATRAALPTRPRR